MKKLFRLVLFVCILISSSASVFSQALENTLLWEVSGKGLSKPSYLFGTYHLLNNEFLDKKQPKALDCFRKSEGVVVETVIDTPSMMKAQMHMVMFDNKVSALLDTAAYRILKKDIQTIMGVDVALLEQMKPMALATILTIGYAKDTNPELAEYKGKPLDQYFATEGTKEGKQVHALETVEAQMTMLFDHYTLQEQAAQLSEMLLKKDLSLRIQKDVTRYYLEQNLQKMYEVSEQTKKDMPSMSNMDYLTVNRNKAWMNQLPAMLQSGSQFIAVGALHLPGPDGLIDLLRKQGYVVKPVL